MDVTQAVIWIFLAIFLLTALIELAALVGLVKLESVYRKRLFTLLITQVITCVIGFGVQEIRQIVSAKTDLRTALLSPKWGWDWQYAEKNWRARFHFKPADKGKVTMDGETYVVNATGDKRLLIRWSSTEPFDVPAHAETVTIKAQRIVTDDAATVDPTLSDEVGKKVAVVITINPQMALEGSAISNDPAKTWGVMMTHAYP
jgi:hypothetical protein